MKEVCLRKKGFDTRKIAKQVARRLHSKRGMRLAVYKCPYCDYFHLTSKITVAYKVKIRCAHMEK